MKTICVQGPLGFNGEVVVAGDKSITHRALILGFLSGNPFCLSSPNGGEDCRRTFDALAAMGMEGCCSGNQWHLVPGSHWRTKNHSVYAGNSGTTARLILGLTPWLAAGCNLTLDGDESLRRRPMDRVAVPLAAAGVHVEYMQTPGCLPLRAVSLGPRAATHQINIASAQVKSALLLAGLAAPGQTSVCLPPGSRDHTERMLKIMGCEVFCGQDRVTIEGEQALNMPSPYQVPGDISAACCWAAGAAVSGKVKIRAVGLNPGRKNFLQILSRMGAEVSLGKVSCLHGEPTGDLIVEEGRLQATRVYAEEVPGCIDELPLVAAVAAHASGTTVIQGAGELRHKESDRLQQTMELLNAFGVAAGIKGETLSIKGGRGLQPGRYISNDHRMVMTAAILAAGAPGRSFIGHGEWTAVSYPGFLEDFANLAALDYNLVMEDDEL